MERANNFVVCLNNRDYPASLERWKIYRVIPDDKAAARGLLRIIDESGEGYLYSSKDFAAIELPQTIARAYLSAA